MWSTEAPANIAFIKCIGRYALNIPCNKSLSFTVDRFRSRVELEIIDSNYDEFEPLESIGYLSLNMPEHGIQKFLKHLSFLKKTFDCNEHFLVKSANNFPNDTGITSSASSFAALTISAVKAFCELQHKDMPSIADLSKLSRVGSGSSCRSFFKPWAVWDGEGAQSIDFPYHDLHYQLALLEMQPKKVSSSIAQIESLTSLLFNGRPERAAQRFADFVTAMKEKDWQKAYISAWQEFCDMHALFCTSREPFWYITADSLAILNKIHDFWQTHKDGPIVTIGAGPNIHFLWREDQDELLDEFYGECEFVLM